MYIYFYINVSNCILYVYLNTLLTSFVPASTIQWLLLCHPYQPTNQPMRIVYLLTVVRTFTFFPQMTKLNALQMRLWNRVEKSLHFKTVRNFRSTNFHNKLHLFFKCDGNQRCVVVSLITSADVT